MLTQDTLSARGIAIRTLHCTLPGKHPAVGTRRRSVGYQADAASAGGVQKKDTANPNNRSVHCSFPDKEDKRHPQSPESFLESQDSDGRLRLSARQFVSALPGSRCSRVSGFETLGS